MNQIRTTELFAKIDATVSEFISEFSKLNQSEINAIPFEKSWTAAQVLRHVEKSTKGISQALLMDAKLPNRNVEERVTELHDIFLNFETKI